MANLGMSYKFNGIEFSTEDEAKAYVAEYEAVNSYIDSLNKGYSEKGRKGMVNGLTAYAMVLKKRFSKSFDRINVLTSALETVLQSVELDDELKAVVVDALREKK